MTGVLKIKSLCEKTSPSHWGVLGRQKPSFTMEEKKILWCYLEEKEHCYINLINNTSEHHHHINRQLSALYKWSLFPTTASNF